MILHTGQHYSYNMDRVLFEQLKLPEAKYNLDVRSGNHAEQTGKMLDTKIPCLQRWAGLNSQQLREVINELSKYKRDFDARKVKF